MESNRVLMEEKEIQEIISGIFKGVTYEIRSLCYHAHKVLMELTYEDYLPESLVKEKLEKEIPDLELTLDRTYSDGVVDDVVDVMRQEFVDVWLYDMNGRLCRVEFYQLLNAYLSDKEVRNGKVITGISPRMYSK